MRTRKDLHIQLVDILGSDNVYFQPPQSIRLVFPCIVYELSDFDIIHADDGAYNIRRIYTATLMTKDPDDFRIQKLIEFKYSEFDRPYSADNIHHYVYRIFY